MHECAWVCMTSVDSEYARTCGVYENGKKQECDVGPGVVNPAACHTLPDSPPPPSHSDYFPICKNGALWKGGSPCIQAQVSTEQRGSAPFQQL